MPFVLDKRLGWFFAVAAEIMLSLYTMIPKLSLKMGDPTDVSNILSAPALLSNDGILPIYDISVSCIGPGMIRGRDGMVVFPAGSRGQIVRGIKTLGSGGTVKALDVCRATSLEHPISVDAVIRVDFKPLLFPRDHKEFRIRSRAGIQKAVDQRSQTASTTQSTVNPL